jgi:membrane protease YdiL (CAAX protease family)
LESISWHQNDRQFLFWLIVGGCLGYSLQLATGVVQHQYSLRFSLYSVLGMVTLQPLIEETYFRGVLFESLSKRIDPLHAITIVTVVFVMLHVQHRLVVVPVAKFRLPLSNY